MFITYTDLMFIHSQSLFILNFNNNINEETFLRKWKMNLKLQQLNILFIINNFINYIIEVILLEILSFLNYILEDTFLKESKTNLKFILSQIHVIITSYILEDI